MHCIREQNISNYQIPNKENYQVDWEDYLSLAKRFKPGTVENHIALKDYSKGVPIDDKSIEEQFVELYEDISEIFIVDLNSKVIYMSRQQDIEKCYIYTLPPEDLLEPPRPQIVLETREQIQALFDYIAEQNKKQSEDE